MSIEKRIRQALADDKRQDSADFQHLRDFYEEKKRDGVVVRQEYTLPPMDTVGRSLHTTSIREGEDEEK